MKRRLLQFISGIIITYTLIACASMGAPTGGPKDIDPPLPVYEKSTPLMNELHVDKRKITIYFDENIAVKKPQEKVIISPAQKQPPIIQSAGKKVFVRLKDTLLPNITYTIDFGDAIADLNEGNPLPQFSYAFSTGDHIDTMEIAGTLINAYDHELIKNTIVGVLADNSDTAFTKRPLLRMAKTDEHGRFIIHNLARGNYKVVALDDKNRNYYYDQGSEQIAFIDTLITPTCFQDLRPDTIWQDSITIDTIQMVPYTHYEPDNLVLHLFKKEKPRQYLQKKLRVEQKKLIFYMSTKVDSSLSIKLLNSTTNKPWFVKEQSAGKDTITYWITDTQILEKDTIALAVTYPKSDSINQIQMQTDTIKLLDREKKKREKAARIKAKKREKLREKYKDKDQPLPPEPIVHLGFEENLPSLLDFKGEFYVEFNRPLAALHEKSFHLYHKNDTSWLEVPFRMRKDTINARKFYFTATWDPKKEYSFRIDSAACMDVYHFSTDYYRKDFNIRKASSYSTITFQINPIKEKAFVQLLNSHNEVVRQVEVIKGKAKIEYINPETYYARLFIDKNKNKHWDTGDYEKKKQPEPVYYFPKELKAKANWEVNENWSLFKTPILRQKPDDLREVPRFGQKVRKDKDKRKERRFEFEIFEDEEKAKYNR